MKLAALSIIIILLSFQDILSKIDIHDLYKFRHIVKFYKGDSVHIVIKSKDGEEAKKKPILFFVQGSLPKPLFLFDDKDVYEVFPFNPNILTENYHLAIIGKPYIPLSADIKKLGQNFSYIEDSTGKFPKAYSDRNLPDYYVNRNIEILEFLLKQDWVDNSKLIVAGHSEGSNIATRIASKFKKVTHLIFAAGNPYGRIVTMIQQNRSRESYDDSTHYAENEFQYWQEAINNKNNMDDTYGDTFKATYDFSEPLIPYLVKLKIPVLIVYGTKDWSAPYIDLMRVDFIRQGKDNFTYYPIVGAEHNFFPKDASGKINNEIFNWDKVAKFWNNWIIDNN